MQRKPPGEDAPGLKELKGNMGTAQGAEAGASGNGKSPAMGGAGALGEPVKPP